MDRACQAADADAFLLYRQALIFLVMNMPQQTAPARQPAQQSQQTLVAEPEQERQPEQESEQTRESEQAHAAQVDKHTRLCVSDEFLDEGNYSSSCSSPGHFDNWVLQEDLDIQDAWQAMQENL
jgi:hypothetical protein